MAGDQWRSDENRKIGAQKNDNRIRAHECSMYMHTTKSRDEWICDKQFWCMPVYLRKSIAHSSIRVNGEDLKRNSIVLKLLLRNHWQVDEKVGASAVPHFGLVNFITYWDWLSPAYSVAIVSASDCSFNFKIKITSEECASNIEQHNVEK